MFLKCYKVFSNCKTLVNVVFCIGLLWTSGLAETDFDSFFRAVTDGRGDRVRAFLDSHPEWVDREIFLGIRPLYRAAVLGRSEVAQILLEKGATAVVGTNRGNLPLHACAGNGHLAVVQMLVAAKAPLDSPDENGSTPLHLAARNKHLKVLEFLVEQGANLDVKDSRGRTPLHLAAGLGMLELVEPLVRQGAELNPIDQRGYSPLGWARTTKRNSFGDVGGFLEAKGAKDIRPDTEPSVD